MTVVTHFHLLDQSQDNILGARLQGRLTETDLRNFSEELKERSAAHGRMRVLLELKVIKGLTPEELWEDLRTGSPELLQSERLALVCHDEDYRRWLAALEASLIEGEVQYFEPQELRAAWQWLRDVYPSDLQRRRKRDPGRQRPGSLLGFSAGGAARPPRSLRLRRQP